MGRLVFVNGGLFAAFLGFLIRWRDCVASRCFLLIVGGASVHQRVYRIENANIDDLLMEFVFV